MAILKESTSQPCLPLTSSAEDSPASPCHAPGSGRATKTKGGSGRSSTGRFAKLAPNGSWLKMYQGFCQHRTDGSLEAYSETWPAAGTMRNGICSRQPPLVPRTSDFACFLWPTPEAAQGELMRFFAEAVWYPTALLPSQGVCWEAVDNTLAKATIRDGDVTVTLLFRFNDDGLIGSVRAEARGRVVNGAVIPTPWEGRLWRYELRDGMHVPMEAEVAWVLAEGPKPYWRGRIMTLSYEFEI